VAEIDKLDYFGTSLNDHGHYFWLLSDNEIKRSGVKFSSIPFDPEQLLDSHIKKGAVKYFKVDNYSICAIAGSCTDKRMGTKSVFWTKEPVEFKDFKEIILKIPAANKIIKQMPFDIGWCGE
jgi:hypothetical protein